MEKLKRFLDNSITVGELKDILEDYDDDMKVVKAYNYGDHCRTEVAETIGEPEEDFVKYSDYHRMGKVSKEGFKEEDSEKVLVL